MFSYLSRGYGTWEGVAKLEKPDSAISNGFSSEDFFLPPILNRERQSLYEQTTYDFHSKHLQEKFRLPTVANDSTLDIPKTYSTKSGALLLYSEGCFVPGSRRLKKRPKLKKRKEKRLQTLKDLTNIIMDYKKNEGDPLLLAQLWRKANNSVCDVRPGFSPQRYLTHLGCTTFDPDLWRKLADEGSLKSLERLKDDSCLPLLLQDHKFADELLKQKPQPYTTMSLPPVSPSSSMLGSFTFYKHGMSTGAASLVSMNSMNADRLDEHISEKSGGTCVESLAERLAEIESESGLKGSYEDRSPKEKEDLLTQLTVDAILHNQGEVAPLSPENSTESTTCATPVESLDKSGSSRSSKSGQVSRSLKFRSLRTLKSASKGSVFSSVCSLPPIESPKVGQDTVTNASEEPKMKDQQFDSLSSSRSGLHLTPDDLSTGLDGTDSEIEESIAHIGDSSSLNNSEVWSLKTEMEQALVTALKVQNGEPLHRLNEETNCHKSPKGSSDGSEEDTSEVAAENAKGTSDDSGRLGDGSLSGAVGDHWDSDVDRSQHHGSGGVFRDGGGGGGSSELEIDVSGGSIGGDDGGEVGDGDVSCSYSSSGKIFSDGDVEVVNSGSIADGYDSVLTGGGDQDDGALVTDGGTVDGVKSDVGDHSGQEEVIQPEISIEPGVAPPHISLSSLQDEARLVAGQVLSRPKSGRSLVDDAEMATALLMKRMEGLLAPVMKGHIRVSSAAPMKFRPLGQPRNCELSKRSKDERRDDVRNARSAGPSMFTRRNEKRGHVETILHDREDREIATRFKNGDEVPSEEQRLSEANEGGILTSDDQPKIASEDIIINTKESQEPGTQHVKTEPETPSPRNEIAADQVSSSPCTSVDQRSEDITAVKDEKKPETVEAKGKRRVNSKKSNMTKGKRKKKQKAEVVATKNEPAKTPPFRTGLVPEQRPPKGLDPSSDDDRTKPGSNKVTPDLKAERDEKEPELKKPAQTPEVPVRSEKRVDSETGEVERRVSSSGSEKSPSPLKLASSTDESPSPVIEQMSSPRDNTPSPRESTPPPRDQEKCPREKTPSPGGKTEEPAVVLDSGTPPKEPSPEVPVVLSERTKRANARAAQRAAAAERRRQEVERKRREREEARRRAQEEEARLEELRLAAEEEMKRREDDRRVQKEQEERERCRLEAEEKERARQERLLAERQRAAREEWKRKKEQLISQRKLEEDMRKERERIEQQVEEERRLEYEARIAHLEDEERERLLEERRLEEERIKREIEEERLRREEERQRVLEERRRMEEELQALREKQIARQMFLEGLLKDYQNLLLEQRITGAFTFSYFDILPWFQETWSRSLDERTGSTNLETTALETVQENDEGEVEEMV